ncbi:MAG: hypothetical protein E6Q97_22115 [Desulfurellales bacterium]|nr:MAG: hypothetical protein E6Q97_22115 [Desulfurellales bacterium]
MPNLNELTLDELAALGAQIATLVTAGKSLEAGRLGPVFDLTPGAPITIYTNAVMPGAADYGQPVQFSMEVTGLDDGDETEGRRIIDCAGITTAEVAGRIANRAFERDLGIDAYPTPEPRRRDLPSFLKRESTEAPSDATDVESVDPPQALGEVVGGGPVSAEPSRLAEADAVPQDAAEAGAEAESGGGEEVAAPETPAAPEQRQPASAWTKAEDDALIRLIVQGMMGEGLSRSAAIIAAARSIGRPGPGTLWRVAKVIKAQVDAALTAAATKQAQTETPEIPPAEPVGASVSRDAAAGGHSPAEVQELDADTLCATFERQVDAMPDLHGEELRVWQWIAAHRAKWPHTAGTDLDLAVALSRGEKLNLIALDLGIDKPKLQERWNCLSRPIRNSQDNVTIDGMPRLINILRRIAKAPAAAA